MKKLQRCGWAVSEIMIAYHDAEWGVPVHDDRKLFEFLVLEGAQAGLSWETILKRRSAYRAAFRNFDPAKVAEFTAGDVQRLLKDSGIIRNRLKITSAIENAKRFIAVKTEFGSFDGYVWGFVRGKPVKNGFRSLAEIPAKTRESEELSKALRERGFSFVGPTIMYAFMQTTGMVNDHVASCFRHSRI